MDIWLILKAISHRKAATLQHWLPMRRLCHALNAQAECQWVAHAQQNALCKSTMAESKVKKSFYATKKACIQAAELLLSPILASYLKLSSRKQCKCVHFLPPAIYLLLFMHFCQSQIWLSASFKGHERLDYKGRVALFFFSSAESFPFLLVPNLCPRYSCQILRTNPRLFESDSSWLGKIV